MIVENVVPSGYVADMTVSAHDVAAEFRRRHPGLPAVKLHKLLYFAQAHHLADLDRPLFGETVSAWDMGPVVGQLFYAERNGEPAPEPKRLSNGELNTISYVLSRYGNMSGLDLQILSHAQKPWQLADQLRPPGGSVRIEREWMRDYFRAAAEVHEEGEVWFTREKIAALTAGAAERRAAMGEPGANQSDRLRARLLALQGGRASA